MKNDKNIIVESLSGNDVNIFPHLSYLLQDLLSLGSNPEILLQLIERNFSKLSNVQNVLELCCGKGAALINIVKKYNWHGKGIDLYEPFISEAKLIASEESLSAKIDFQVMNIKDAIKNLHDFDLIITGYETDLLGSEIESLKQIINCASKNGFILYETAHEKSIPFDKLLNENNFKIIDKIEHNSETVKAANLFNTNKIKQRANELAKEFPDKKELFFNYVELQEKECFELENNCIFVSYLLNFNQ